MPPKKIEPIHEVLKAGTELSDGKGNIFLIEKQIGKGGFGIIYSSHKKADNKCKYAVKTEPKGNGPLFVEISVFRNIAKESQITPYMKEKKLSHLGVPEFISMGFHNDIRFLVMPLFSSSLEFGILQNKLSPTSFKAMCCQMIDSLEYIHSMKYVHSDIKSENIMTNDFQKFFLVDFGIASLYIIKDKHVIEKPDKKLMNNGTLEFLSLDSHSGLPLSRRSDLQELVINLMSWACRIINPDLREKFHDSLPWGKLINMKDKMVYEKVKKAKENCFSNPDEWCSQIKIKKDQNLSKLIKYSHTMGYSENPEYSKLREFLSSLDIMGKEVKKTKPDVMPSPNTRSSLRKKPMESDDSVNLSSGDPKKKPAKKRGKPSAPSNILSDESDDILTRKTEEFKKKQDGKPVVLNSHITSLLEKKTRSSPRKKISDAITIATQTSPELLKNYQKSMKSKISK